MLMAMDDESLTVASLLAERQESFRKMSGGRKYSQHAEKAVHATSIGKWREETRDLKEYIVRS
jgi:hypothetical protein